MIRVSDSEWERIRDHFDEENIPDGRPGRKPTPTRPVFEAALWILNTGAQWHMLPQCFPNYKTVHRRFQAWCQNEVLRRVLIDIANELRERGGLDEEECFIDATFVMAKGGGAEVAPTKRGKGTENHSDSAASFKPDEATDAGPTAPKPILPALTGRALFCQDPMATSHPRALGIVI